MSKIIRAAIAAAPLAFGAFAAQAATIDPADFDLITSEGQRTATVDGADVSGLAVVVGNPDNDSAELGSLRANDDILTIGRVVEMRTPTAPFTDEYTFASARGQVDVNVINFAESSRGGVSPFTGLFELLVDDTLVESFEITSSSLVENTAFSTLTFVNNQKVTIRVSALEGISDYDIGVSGSFAVPLPASLPLFLGGLAGLAVVARRRKSA
ncbi:MAG: VPLPA-CTERM sorting domain-containing protein [Pseudomonadota bacterium]